MNEGEIMNTAEFFWILMAFSFNMVIGAAVLAAIDDDGNSLYNWYMDCPLWLFGQPLVLTFWPILLYLHYKPSNYPPDDMKWNYEGKPSQIGWYAVLICYDENEGVFPNAAWWDGDRWSRKSVICFGDMRCTEQEAEQLAYDHDPDA